jgi:hypothetical protein
VLRGEVLPRRQAGEVDCDVCVARRRGLCACARPPPFSSAFQFAEIWQSPASQASPARSRPHARHGALGLLRRSLLP